MNGIHFILDDNDNKVAVQFNYSMYKEYLEDFIDGLIAESRKNEDSISLEDAVKKLSLNEGI